MGKNIRFRVNLDLHTVAGSQNSILTDLCDSFIQIGSFRKERSRSSHLANAQRTFNYIRTITEFISQPEYRSLSAIIGVVKEPLVKVIGTSAASRL